MYDRIIGRYRWPSLLLTFMLLGLWYAVSEQMVEWPRPPADRFLLAGGLVALAYALFAWVGPVTSYVQPRKDHVRLQTPIYRIKISYRRVMNTRTIELGRLFPPSSLSRGQRRLLGPLAGRTGVVLDLDELPIRRIVMRLFLNRFFFPPDSTGLVLVVDKWLELSKQLSGRIEVFRSARQARTRERLAQAIIPRESDTQPRK